MITMFFPGFLTILLDSNIIDCNTVATTDKVPQLLTPEIFTPFKILMCILEIFQGNSNRIIFNVWWQTSCMNLTFNNCR